MIRRCFLILLSVLSTGIMAHGKSIGDTIARPDSVLKVAKALMDKKDWVKAEKTLADLKPLILSQYGVQSPQNRETNYLLSLVAFNRNELDKALESFQVTLKLYRESYDSVCFNASQCNSLISQVFLRKGDFISGEAYILEALRLRRKIYGTEDLEYAKMLQNVGSFYGMKQAYDKAEFYLSECMKIRKSKLGIFSQPYAANLRNLAELYYNTDRFEMAESLCREAINIFDSLRLKDKIEYPLSYMLLGQIYEALGRRDKEEKSILTAYASFQMNPSLQNTVGYGNCCTSLGVYYYDLGSYDKSVKFYQKALDIYQKMSNGIETAQTVGTISNLLRIYSELGIEGGFENQFQHAYDYYRKNAGEDHGYTLTALQNLLEYQLKINSPTLNDSIFRRNIDLNLSNGGNKALGTAKALSLYANYLIRKKNYEEAIDKDTQAIHLLTAEFGSDYHLIRTMQLQLARAYYKLNLLNKSAACLLQAGQIEKVNKWKSLAFMSEQEAMTYYNKINKDEFNLYSEPGDQNAMKLLSNEAFDDILFNKGILLYSLVRKARLIEKDVAIEKLDEAFRQSKRKVASEYAKPISHRLNMDSLQDLANKAEKKLNEAIQWEGESVDKYTWKYLQPHLNSNEAILEMMRYPLYALGEKTGEFGYAALILKNEGSGPDFIPLCTETELDRLLDFKGSRRIEYVSNLYWSQQGKSRSSRKDLYQLVWMPLEKSLKNCHKIYFSPTGHLHKINFNAIALEDHSLIQDRFTLVQMNSARDVISQKKETDQLPGEFVLYGGINYEKDTSGLNPIDSLQPSVAQLTRGQYSFYSNDTSARRGRWKYLAGTNKEVEQIRIILQNSNCQVQLLSGSKAGEASFKAMARNANGRPSPRLIHFSTHGFFLPDSTTSSVQSDSILGLRQKTTISPMLRSGLILAGANSNWNRGLSNADETEDGILTAYEISTMDLSNTALVVLSACETGLGDIQGNEGVYGLQRAFKIAGVHNILMSLWQVPDKQTSELMVLFYKNWITQKMTIRDALYKAQDTMRKKGYEPYYWAGFVLME